MKEPIKGAYLASSAYVRGAEYGSVAGKIAAQVRAFKRAGLDCDLIPVDVPETRWGNAINWAPFLPTLEGWNPALLSPEYSFLYIRKPIFSRKFLRFLRAAKGRSPETKIILEIPTYPYDKEMQGAIAGVSLAKDRHYRTKLHRYVDRIADLSRTESIFGIPTLPMINGIDTDAVSTRKPSLRDGEIHILSVSGMCLWHGIDRAIAGLAAYQSATPQKPEIVLHLAGEGPELERLQLMAEKACLGNAVIFHGELTQDELAKLYDQCTLALASLGSHRLGIAVSSAIKSREYLAKGIPFIYSTPIDILDDDDSLCLHVAEDESPLDFARIIEFHDQLYAAHAEEKVIEELRALAEARASMDRAMNTVIDYVRSGV